MKECFIERSFSPSSRHVVEQANAICRDYANQGYDLTLRQLYYQFVSKGFIPNKDTEYKRLGSIINDARLAGQLDWDYITDRTRNLAQLLHFDDPADRIDHAAKAYRIDLWEGQENRVEVWVEKEALAGVVERAAKALDVPYFSCRGYVSQSEMWAAGKRLAGYIAGGQRPIILHLGDHDPSGIDMTRDITERLWMFACNPSDFNNLCYGVKESWGSDWGPEDLEPDALADAWESCCGNDMPNIEVHRIAHNMAQIRQYNPPPNPAKITDSRATSYIKLHGNQSWELDALDPATLNALIRTHTESFMDMEMFHERLTRQERERALLVKSAERWHQIAEQLEESE